MIDEDLQVGLPGGEEEREVRRERRRHRRRQRDPRAARSGREYPADLSGLRATAEPGLFERGRLAVQNTTSGNIAVRHPQGCRFGGVQSACQDMYCHVASGPAF